MYVRRERSKAEEADDAIAADINSLNGYMALANKPAVDNSLAEWMYVAGVGYRLTLPNPKWTPDGDEPPFSIYSLDPAKTFIIVSSFDFFSLFLKKLGLVRKKPRTIARGFCFAGAPIRSLPGSGCPFRGNHYDITSGQMWKGKSERR